MKEQERNWVFSWAERKKSFETRILGVHYKKKVFFLIGVKLIKAQNVILKQFY